MTAPGQYAAGDGSFGRSAGGAVGRGVVLVLIAVAIGAFLLRSGFDGTEARVGQSSAATPAEDASSEDNGESPVDPAGNGSGNGDETPPVETTAAAPLPTRDPSQVKVAAVNGTGTVGLAGRTADLLGVHGYVTGAKNAVNVPVAVSVIYYRAGFSEDAKAVATHLRAPADIIAPASEGVLDLIANSEEVADFNVFVIVGADEVIPV